MNASYQFNKITTINKLKNHELAVKLISAININENHKYALLLSKKEHSTRETF